jgi:predicted PurR-regulated permease PerM
MERTRVTNAFQLGLTGGLGVLTAIVLGSTLAQTATIITYVGIALFVALGMDPIVRAMVRAKIPRIIAVAVVILGFLSAVALLFWAVIPTAVNEAVRLVNRVPDIVANLISQDLIASWDVQTGGAISSAANNALDYVSDANNWPTLVGGVLEVGFGILSGLVGFIIVVILSIYFMASLEGMKDYLAKLVAASKRERFKKLTDQVALSVGRWVMGQTSVALLHGLMLFIFLTIMGSQFSLLLSLLAFVIAFIPLIGSASAGIIVVGVSFLSGSPYVIPALMYYLVYLQVEAYLISPRVMKKAVSIPASIVVIAALLGGTLMGVLGALVAIPIAASILLIVREVWMPLQQLR